MSLALSHKLKSGISDNASWPIFLLGIVYCISGLTAIAYEVLWARMLAMQFGVSIFGVVLTVAATMFGLGAGSLIAAGWVARIKRPLILFACLELGIALYALLTPILLEVVSVWLDASAAAQLTLLQWYSLQFVAGVLLLVLPTFAMGAGFVAILKAVAGTPLSLGKVYGLNTIGGAAGALLPLISLPMLGWVVSIKIIALLGIAAAAAVWLLSPYFYATEQVAVPKDGKASRPPYFYLLIYAGIGVCSLMLEIAWVRLYGMVMLRTEYVLAVILAVYLLGIALGSLLLPVFSKIKLEKFLPLIAGLGGLASLWLLPTISAWTEQAQFQTFFGALWAQAFVLGMATLPVTLVLGAWLPLIARNFCQSEMAGAWLYGANALGGGIGAISGSLVAIPLLGSAATVVLGSLGITMLGLVFTRSSIAWFGFAVMLLLAWPLRNLPPVNELLPRAQPHSKNIYLYEDAISLTHVVQQQDGQRVLLTDLQRMDASTEPDAVKIQADQARLPLLLHANPHSVLFLGLGTGISTLGSAAYPDLQRSAVELSRGAIIAAENWFTPVNGKVIKQVAVTRDDARHFLSSNSQKYDVIVGDLFHPDLAGMSSLLSVQQFQRVRQHLNADGIFVQWLALNQFDTQSLDIVLRSFRQIFPEAQMFMDGMHLALVGPEKKFSGANAVMANLRRLPAHIQNEVTGGEGAWTWLGRYWGPISESIGPVQDEWEPLIEFNLPRAKYDGKIDLTAVLSELLKQRPDTDSAGKMLHLQHTDQQHFERAYLATDIAVRSWVAFIQSEQEKATRLIWLAYQSNQQDSWIANTLADIMLKSISSAESHGLSKRDALLRVLKIYPNHVETLRMLWHMEQAAGNNQAAETYRTKLLQISPLDREARHPQPLPAP